MVTERSPAILHANPKRVALLYVLVLGTALALVLGISSFGEWALASGRPLAAPSAALQSVDTMLHVLLALAVVIVTARIVGAVFSYLHQPSVIGEVVGGIILGPSLLGLVAPSAQTFLLPPEAAPFLGVIAQLGVVLYMFIVGLHLDLRVLRTSGHATLAISHASILAPLVLGTLLALGLYRGFAGDAVSFTSFALFLGVSMSVTAFPVLARILGDQGLHKTELGMLALTCAAVDDVSAWCLLAFVVSVTQATLAGAFVTLGLTVAYITAMLLVVRPAIGWAVPLLEQVERLNQGGLAVIFVALLVSALATEFIGIHAIFGAFLLGAVIPHTSRVAVDVTERLEDLVRVMFLPAFFAFTGMRTQVGLVASSGDWALCGLIIAVATLGKFGGTYAAGRFVGLGRADAGALGILMNTRGLVELIVLNIGLDMGAISPRLFTMLVIMALVTTFMHGWTSRFPVDRRGTARAVHAASRYRGTVPPSVSCCRTHGVNTSVKAGRIRSGCNDNSRSMLCV
jgi:Kef-type K+ transport system membrane component KefB